MKRMDLLIKEWWRLCGETSLNTFIRRDCAITLDDEKELRESIKERIDVIGQTSIVEQITKQNILISEAVEIIQEHNERLFMLERKERERRAKRLLEKWNKQ